MQTEPTKAGERTQDERTKEEQRTQHTPGPWKIRKREGKFTQVFILDAANKGAIAEISPFGNVENGWVHEANARLIAAAPEMLNALKACVKALQWFGDNQTSSCAYAAIAKAEGERK